ncbi:MAG: DNA repair protein RadC [Chthoniobacterales bacterium]
MQQMFLFRADTTDKDQASVCDRVLRFGPDILSNREHLSVLLNDGQAADQMLGHFGSLSALGRAGLEQLREFTSEERALRVVSALRFASAVVQEEVAGEPVSSPDAVCRLVGGRLRCADREMLLSVLLNTQQRLIKVETVSIGTVNEALAHPREVFKPAIAHSAYSLVVVHNHPSGDPRPSDADARLTRRLADAAKLLQIPLLDHVIIGQPGNGTPGYFSFREAGMIG